MEAELNKAVRTILFREKGKATISNVISSLRNMGWKKLGSVDDFEKQCSEAGYQIENQFKTKDGKQVKTRTYIVLQEELA